MIETPDMSASTAAAPACSNYQSIPIAQIRSSPYQARQTFHEDGLRSLAESMRQEGQLQPIVVRTATGNRQQATEETVTAPDSQLPVASCPLPLYELISGERRLRAAKLLGWTAIEAKVIQTVSEAEAAAKGMTDNLQRVDLDPIEEAKGFAELNRLDPGYWTQARIAEVTGKSQSHISEMIRLLNLSEQVIENIRQRILTLEHGAELLRLPNQELQNKAADKIKKHDLSVKKARDMVNKMLKHEIKNEKFGRPRKDPLADIWPEILTSPDIEAAGAWQVTYRRDAWNFTIHSSGVPSKEALAAWFRQMSEVLYKAEALSETDTHVDIENPKSKIDTTRLQQTPEEVVTGI